MILIKDVYKKATCLYDKETVEKEIDRLALEIQEKLSDKNPLVLSVMIGGLVLTGSLLTRLYFPLEVDYIHATRYQGEIVGAELHWKATPFISVKDRTVLIVDDILDQGLTLKTIIEYCEREGAKEIYTAVLVDKEGARKPEGLQKTDFTGLKIPNRYVFGYGLDYKNYLRNAPGIFMVEEM